jgi:hypothetical protein
MYDVRCQYVILFLYDVTMYDAKLCLHIVQKQHCIMTSYIFYIAHRTKTILHTDIVHILHRTSYKNNITYRHRTYFTSYIVQKQHHVLTSYIVHILHRTKTT